MATREEQRTIGELFGQLSQDVSLLVRQEVALARVELTDKANQLRRDAMAVLAGAAVAYFGALALMAALILILAQVIGITAWLSALLVGVILGVTGYLMIQRSLKDVRRFDATPERTVATLKDDLEWVKEQRP